jgi:hypothetical protein
MNRRTAAFHALFAALPANVQRLARAAFAMFLANPAHPGLRSHTLKPTKKGQHQISSISVTFAAGYRAIYVVQNGVNVWYWIGTHSDYDTFTGRI